MDGFGIQVSIKTPQDTLINVRGSDTTEFDLNLSHVLEKVGEIQAAEAAVRGLPVPSAAVDAVGLLQEKLGAEVIGEYPTPPAPANQWAPPPQAPPVYQQTHCERCKQAPTCKTCNVPAKTMPRSIKDGQYWIHDCPSGSRDHKGAWCNLPK